jgi:hypothetical protein
MSETYAVDFWAHQLVDSDIEGPRLVPAYTDDLERISDLAVYHERTEADEAAAKVNAQVQTGAMSPIRVVRLHCIIVEVEP